MTAYETLLTSFADGELEAALAEYGTSLRHLRELVTLVGLSDGAREGIAAFFAKREPEWKGR